MHRATGAWLPQRFIEDCLRNRNNRELLARLPVLGLPQPWVVAGCLFQTVWNLRSGCAPEAQIADYDLFYFDAADLSATAEESVQRRVTRHFADLGVAVEAINQARVHLWYQSHFGHPYAALASASEGIDRFPVRCTCVGLQPRAVGLPSLHTPYGLDDLYAGILRPNPALRSATQFQRKAASYRSRWPWLTIEADIGQGGSAP